MSYTIKEFKPCPFCGRIWMFLDSYPEGYFAVRCLCGANGPKKTDKREAIEGWNTRDRHLLWNPFRLSIRFPKDILSVDFKGSLDSVDFASVLQMLASGDKTGILSVIRDHARSAICLKDGNIIAASDTTGLRLGQILYNNGMISHQRLQEALKEAKKSGRMIGETLLSMGYVTQDILKQVIHQQVQEAVLELFFWKEGYFEYRDCVVDFDKDGIHAVSTMEIIMESVRRLDEWDELKRKGSPAPSVIERHKSKARHKTAIPPRILPDK
ncbi:MAG: hypothetical protein BWK80_52235 [Desulfobacteraceae bacterium IS3]|nr:MAG: hypothetical protein BWK80_52235 [Desulfobacteraceae bacterium IS3]